jgi:hypothetical protein
MKSFQICLELVFEASPAESEQEIVQEADEALKLAYGAIELAEGYQDFNDIMKKAMRQPSPESEALAWKKACECADKAKKFHHAGQALRGSFGHALEALVSEDEKAMFVQKQAVCSKLASIVECALRFDTLRLRLATLSNDLAYYRRNMFRQANQTDMPFREDEATDILTSLANMNPWISALEKTASELIKTSPIQIPQVLALLANVCLALSKSSDQEEPVRSKLMFASIGAIVIYDRVVPEGAFSAKGLNVKSATNLVVNEVPNRDLAIALRYSTFHFDNESTPQAIKNMLDSAQ